MEIERHPSRRVAAVGEEDDGDVVLVEQVRLTVPTTDDPTCWCVLYLYDHQKHRSSRVLVVE